MSAPRIHPRKVSFRVNFRNIQGKDSEPVGTNDRQYNMYNLVDMHGGGELVPWMRYALNSGDYSLIDGYIETKVKVMMYNGGKGKLESVAELVKRRNKERNERLGAFSRKKGKGKSGPNILDDFNQEANQGDLKKALKLLDGGKGGKGDAKYREMVWKLDERGSMGENIVGCCLMMGSAMHNKLAMRLIQQYPKLVNDIFISEDYYGLSPLHQAIVNEDPGMVSYLLNNGADINQRCYGGLFCPVDQISSRSDSLEHEYVDLNVENTNYAGKLYFGEYPLAFAACTNQKDCYQILRAKRADPNCQDTNGNTVLHMTVIHENLDMFLLAYNTGARLQMMNAQNLTPLTLAAKLAKKRMFEQILKLESDVLWKYGDAASTAFPLAKIDTINQETGELNEDSALSLIVYGESTDHLDLLDGLVDELLQAKWKAFGRKRWITSLLGFGFYWCCFFAAFMCRPFSMTTRVIVGRNNITNGIATMNYNDSESERMLKFFLEDWQIEQTNGIYNNMEYTFIDFIFSFIGLPHQIISLFKFDTPECQLWNYSNFGIQGRARLFAELSVVGMCVFQIVGEIQDIRSIGRKRWWQVLKSFPAKILYKVSLLTVMLIVPVRFSCSIEHFLMIDNLLSVMAVIMTTVHFLFYCRAIKFVGPFVLMVYTIITRDIIRFFMIYVIFVMGFSQAFFILFLSCERKDKYNILAQIETGNYSNNATAIEELKRSFHVNIMSNPLESILRIFISTIGEFTVLYKELSWCPIVEMEVLGKVLFLVFEMFVSIMHFNLLIAMMTRTYELIYRTQKEWKRQWAQVILMLELSLQPKERLIALLKYSRPLGSDKRRRAFVSSQKIDNQNETEKFFREQQENEKIQEKKQVLKRRLRDYNKDAMKHGNNPLRPFTSYLTTKFSPHLK